MYFYGSQIPDLAHLWYPVFRWILPVALLVFLPVTGVILSRTFLSVICSLAAGGRRDTPAARLSEDLVNSWIMHPLTWAVLCAGPAFGVIIFFRRILNADGIFPPGVEPVIQLGLPTGLLLLYFHKHASPAWQEDGLLPGLIGIAGILLVGAAFVTVIAWTGLLMSPDDWLVARHSPKVLLSWNNLARIHLFTVLSFAAAGGGILIKISRTGETGPEEWIYRRFRVRFGTVLSLVAALILPILLLSDLMTLPLPSLSIGIYLLSAAAFLLLAAISLRLIHLPGAPGRRHTVPVLAGFLLLFLVLTLADQLARINVTQEETLLISLKSMEAAPLRVRTDDLATGKRRLIQNGHAIFQRICSACHRFDRRLVGPPLDTVLPKYRNDMEGLKSFIRNPVKKNPDYPPMPRLGLKEEEIEAAAAYLLEGSRKKEQRGSDPGSVNRRRE